MWRVLFTVTFELLKHCLVYKILLMSLCSCWWFFSGWINREEEQYYQCELWCQWCRWITCFCLHCLFLSFVTEKCSRQIIYMDCVTSTSYNFEVLLWLGWGAQEAYLYTEICEGIHPYGITRHWHGEFLVCFCIFQVTINCIVTRVVSRLFSQSWTMYVQLQHRVLNLMWLMSASS